MSPLPAKLLTDRQARTCTAAAARSDTLLLPSGSGKISRLSLSAVCKQEEASGRLREALELDVLSPTAALLEPGLNRLS